MNAAPRSMEPGFGTGARRTGIAGGTGAAALALGLAAALVLGAGEAAAQRVCSNTPTGGQTIDCTQGGSSTSDIDIDAHDVAISTTAQTGFGVYARHQGSGNVNIGLTGGSVTTTGTQAYGIIGWHVGASGAVDIDLKNVVIKTDGFNAFGVVGVHQGAGTVAVNVDIEGGVVETTGYPSHAVHALQVGPGDVTLGLKDATVRTTNTRTAHGVFAQHRGATGNLRLDVQGGSVETFGLHSFGVFGRAVDTPEGVEVSVADASVTTRGRLARAIAGRHRGAGAVSVDVSGNTAVTAEGEGGIGVEAFSGGGGAVELAVGADVAIEAPFANGIVGRQTVAPGRQITAPGRIVVTHRGNVRARNVGVFAWVDPMSVSTFGDGNEAADETAGTAPMIHVISSGDVTVGEGVMDAYIRAAVAGEDETLQAGEQAVLDAIEEDDSDALDTALDALPDDYNDVWKARMRGFRAARAQNPTDRFSWTAGIEPTTPTIRLADETAAEILGLSHAGIRAMALSHVTVVEHIRLGDVDPAIFASIEAITAIAANTRTPQQRETLAAQQEMLDTQPLSAAERTVLEAALTGGDLETALAALPAAYTDAWKDEVRRLAAGYNAGDIQVDVTGGTIVSDGDGVDARYVVPHDRNGAIVVTVAEGASVTGGRHGVHVGGAGLDDDGLRAHTVTVNGAVMGGTGAGVHLAGGGTVTVGRTGRVGAASGDGVLSDGAGDLVATVAGRVEGNIRAQDGGALTLNVMEGGVVTGTVHDPVGPLTVRGSVGRLLYGNGGTVTVAATGRLTGVETEALRSAAGDLDVTVAGTVAGDIRGLGDGDLAAVVSGRVDGDLVEEGAGDLRATISGTVAGDVLGMGTGEHTVTVAAGGTVTGAIRLSASTVTVDGAAGQVRFDGGGTVTVGTTGRVAGIEGVGIRSETGDLSATVAGTVAGDVLALGSGEHRVSVAPGGTVTGTVRLASAGGAVAVGGTVERVRLDGGGMVAIGEDGQVTDEDEAIASAQGDLTVVIDRGTEETRAAALSRGVRGAIVERGGDGVPEILTRGEGEDARPVGAPGTATSAPDGAFDVGLETAPDGGVRVARAYAPRARVYEALPSVLLGLNGLPSADERMAAARGPRGTWGLLEAARGSRKAAESETGAGYDHRRYGVRAGVELPVGEGGAALGFSLHHRRGAASVPRGGTIEVQGIGMGVYGMWRRGRLYVDVEAAATRYEAALESASRGRLAEEVSGIGHALGLETGHRFALRLPGAGEVTVTPRARLVRSAVSAPDFTDSVGARVSLDETAALTGRAGVAVESRPRGDGGRLFGSVDVERAFKRETRVSVSGTPLASKAEETRYLIGVGGVHDWSGGRYTVSGKVSYAASGGGSREYGGGVSLTMRF